MRLLSGRCLARCVSLRTPRYQQCSEAAQPGFTQAASLPPQVNGPNWSVDGSVATTSVGSLGSPADLMVLFSANEMSHGWKTSLTQHC